MDPTEDILLNGKRYRIDLTSYREKDLADFSPRATVPGGSISQSELLLYQPLNITDWRHGIGFHWHTDAMGYMYSMGNIDTRQPGIAMLFTAATQIQDTGDANGTKTGMCMFDGDLYSWGSAGLRKYTLAGWVNVYNTLTPVHFALPTGDYLFISPHGRIQKMTTLDVITEAGLDEFATDFLWLTIHKGYIYAGKHGERRIHYASEEDLSDLEGSGPEDAVPDPGLINIGAGAFPTLGAISFGQELFVFRKDGVWVVGSDNIARRVLDYSNEQSDNNFKGYCIFNGYLYFSVRSKIFQWNGSRLVDVTPPRITDQFPYSEIKSIGPMVTANNFMYVLANWINNPTYDNVVGVKTDGEFTSLFCYDGVGWHKLADLVYSGGLAASSSMCYDGDGNRLYISVANSTPSERYDCYFAMGTTNLPSAPYKTGAGDNVLISSRLDMGFRRVKKYSPSLLIEASNISFMGGASDNRYISIYGIFGAGESQSGSDELIYMKLGDVKHNGINEIFLPGVKPTVPPESDFSKEDWMTSRRGDAIRIQAIGFDLPRQSVEPFAYNYIILVAELISENSDQTPILEGMTLRFLLRPDVFYGYNFNIIAASQMVYGDNVDNRNSAAIVDELRSLRDSKVPVAFIDIYGRATNVYISSVTNQAMERHDNQEGTMRSIEGIVNLNLVQCR